MTYMFLYYTAMHPCNCTSVGSLQKLIHWYDIHVLVLTVLVLYSAPPPPPKKKKGTSIFPSLLVNVIVHWTGKRVVTQTTVYPFERVKE